MVSHAAGEVLPLKRRLLLHHPPLLHFLDLADIVHVCLKPVPLILLQCLPAPSLALCLLVVTLGLQLVDLTLSTGGLLLDKAEFLELTLPLVLYPLLHFLPLILSVVFIELPLLDCLFL